MKIDKQLLTNLKECYAASSIVVDGEQKILVASEGEAECYMFSWPGCQQSKVWDGPSGTMSMIPLPSKNGDFLAIQKFFPGFQSENAVIVWAKPKKDGSWETKTLLKLPYLHRFDILSVDNVNYFIGATLCTSKEFEDDWSDPGKIYAGILPEDLSKPIVLEVLKEGLTKNHGYCRVNWKGRIAGMVTSQEGVFLVMPPQRQGRKWHVEQIMDQPVSDIAVIDIDEDGVDEIVTIEDFHGENFLIYKKIKGKYEVVYRYPNKIDFGHVVWGGKLRGIATIIGGCRKRDQELFYIQCRSKNPLEFSTIIIEKGVGPSNVAVINEEDQDIIISANREIGEAALYIVTE